MTTTNEIEKPDPNKDPPKRPRRRVYGLGDVPPEDIEAISKVEMDPKYDYLNAELKDWKP